MGTYKTPGVYIVEKNAFPNSVVEVATAVPAFVGYTEFAVDGNQSVQNKPFRITSMSEFRTHFGESHRLKYKLDDSGIPQCDTPKYSLYANMQLFYANGGGPCYIVSVGKYTDTSYNKDKFETGINSLIEELEPTMLVIPEVINTDFCADIQKQMLAHCSKMQNRVALLDVPQGEENKEITSFRDGTGSDYLSYGVAYYPFLNTSILTERDVTFENLEKESLEKIINRFVVKVKKETGNESYSLTPPASDAAEKDKLSFHNLLYQNSAEYRDVLARIREQLNLLPPSAAMAGIYTLVDNNRGVWKAPANVSVSQVISLSRDITHAQQEDLNVHLTGKSINAIRYFTGDGIKVWGARTLDGNSLDWRYINVRRTMIFLEQSVKNAARAYVFEPNVAATWLNMKSMIENFLRGIWKRGGLAGASPEDAFEVHVGLGDTMTPEDILDGYLRITVLVAISRPAEFIEITFQQQMQKS